MICDSNRNSFRGLVLFLSLGVTLFTATSVRSASETEQEIIERIKPVGVVCVAGENCDEPAAQAAASDAAPTAAAAPSTVAAAAGRSGEQIYNQSCFVCHGAGVAGAPIVGDKGAWTDRIAKGMDVLMANAANGINAMPPRGTCMDCSDEELQASVQYMVDNSQ